jgi:integrase
MILSRPEAPEKEGEDNMGLYRRGKTFWFNIMYQGRRMQESLGTDDRKLAEKIYAKTLTDIIEGRYFDSAKAKNTFFEEMVEKYLDEHAHSRDEHTVKKLLAFFKGYTLFEMSTRFIAEYRTMRSKKVKPATVYQELALLRRMFNVAIREWEWIKDNPVARLSFSVGNKNARDRWLTLEEEGRLLEQATNPRWLRTLLMVALHTGMRRGEILGLEWPSVDLNRRAITVERSKNGEKRIIPMSVTLFNTLKDTKVRGIAGTVFPVSIRSLRVAFEGTLKKARIENCHFHDLRHTFATRLVQNGVDLYKVKELLGHKSITMTMRYAHHYPESLRGSVEVLDHCYNFTTFEAQGN